MTDLSRARPLIVTFRELATALRSLHQNNVHDLAGLHDVWKRCAPTPDSIVRDPRHYDERVKQPGNLEKRIVVPSILAQWIMDISKKRGYPYSYRQAMNLIEGRVDFGLDGFRSDRQP